MKDLSSRCPKSTKWTSIRILRPRKPTCNQVCLWTPSTLTVIILCKQLKFKMKKLGTTGTLQSNLFSPCPSCPTMLKENHIIVAAQSHKQSQKIMKSQLKCTISNNNPSTTMLLILNKVATNYNNKISINKWNNNKSLMIRSIKNFWSLKNGSNFNNKQMKLNNLIIQLIMHHLAALLSADNK